MSNCIHNSNHVSQPGGHSEGPDHLANIRELENQKPSANHHLSPSHHSTQGHHQTQSHQPAQSPYSQSTKNASSADDQQFSTDWGKQMLDKINNLRAEHGLQPLKWSAGLEQMAQNWSQQMKAEGNLHHQQMGHGAMGENIAKGQKTPDAALTAWINSPGHLANILRPSFTEIGVSQSGDYWTMDFS